LEFFPTAFCRVVVAFRFLPVVEVAVEVAAFSDLTGELLRRGRPTGFFPALCDVQWVHVATEVGRTMEAHG